MFNHFGFDEGKDTGSPFIFVLFAKARQLSLKHSVFTSVEIQLVQAMTNKQCSDKQWQTMTSND